MKKYYTGWCAHGARNVSGESKPGPCAASRAAPATPCKIVQALFAGRGLRLVRRAQFGIVEFALFKKEVG